MQEIIIPDYLQQACKNNASHQAWLAQLPLVIQQLLDQWQLKITRPLLHNATCSWVAVVTRADNSTAVLKLGIPHFEAEQEAQALAMWRGEACVFLVDHHLQFNALLLEHCQPATALSSIDQEQQDLVVTGILKKLWAKSQDNGQWRSLSLMVRKWKQQSLANIPENIDQGLFYNAIQLRDELANSSSQNVLLATDLHAGNILKASRQDWLAIDPKPFYGDKTYDLTQHLINCQDRLQQDALTTIKRVADLAEVDSLRLQHWLIARLGCEFNGNGQALARIVENNL